MTFHTKMKNTVALARKTYQNFRLYDVGSYAVNHLVSKQGYQVDEHIAYGLKARHRFDLYRTQQARTQRPLIVFVHGGAWSHGDKQDYRFVGEAFAKEGFDVVVFNYHLAPVYIFPRSVDDLALLLNYLHHHQHEHQISMQNVILMGHSAGAFNIMSVLYHAQHYDLPCKAQIRAAIGIAGPYHFDYKDDPICANAFDQQVPYQQVMPYYFVESNAIRHYLLVATHDKIVHEKNSLDFDHMLKMKQNHSQIIYVPSTGHITIIGSVSSLFSRFFSTKKQILAALDETLATL